MGIYYKTFYYCSVLDFSPKVLTEYFSFAFLQRCTRVFVSVKRSWRSLKFMLWLEPTVQMCCQQLPITRYTIISSWDLRFISCVIQRFHIKGPRCQCSEMFIMFGIHCKMNLNVFFSVAFQACLIIEVMYLQSSIISYGRLWPYMVILDKSEKALQ